MHPILFEFAGITIHTYGFLIAVGFLLSVQLIRRLSIRSGIDPQKMADFSFWFLLVAFGGARLLFVVTRWDYFSADPLAIFKVWEGGLVFFGGLITGLPFIFWYFSRNKISVWKAVDILAPGAAIAHAFGRVGCFAAGCCYGKPTDSFLGLKFDSPLVDRALQGIPLHPTQLYESTALLILTGGLLYLFKRKSFDGQVGVAYLMSYSVIRSIIEMFRGDLVRGFVIDGVLSTSQFISIFVFATGLALMIYRLRNLPPSPKGRRG